VFRKYLELTEAGLMKKDEECNLLWEMRIICYNKELLICDNKQLLICDNK
jgi:hypothetical protein